MKNKKIVVALKYCKGELNPFDGAALECALQSGAKEIIALSMAPMSVMNAFQSLTRLGAKCVLVSDPAFAGSDTQATSLALFEAVKRLQPDLVFCGRQSVDGDTSQVPPMLAQRLGAPVYAKAVAIEGNKVTLRSGEQVTLDSLSVVTFERIKTLRFPSMFSKLGEVEVWDRETLGLLPSVCGQDGSTTKVVKSYESNVGRRFCSFVGGDKLDEIIRSALEKTRERQTVEAAEKLPEAYYVGDVFDVANGIAEKCIPLEVSGRTPEEIAAFLTEKGAQTVFWEDRDDYKILASKTAVLVNAGICADCISFRLENGRLVMTRPAFGGNITADILCTGKIAFATVRTAKKDGSRLIFTIGKGAVAHMDKIKALAEQYGAEVCASRSVVDSGKMPYETQVGLTGKTVSPAVYVAFGVSGAVQHTCAIAGAGTVIAVNVDKGARIFDYADFGIVEDIKNLPYFAE